LGFVVGCDIGTQATKGVLIADDGHVHATASASHGVNFPAPGWAEQDPADWLRALTEVLSALSREARGPIGHIGIAAQVDGVVAVNREMSPLHPGLIWLDRRAVAQAEFIQKRLGNEWIFSTTGLNCDASHGAPKMMWLADVVGELPAYFLPPVAFATSWLTGEVAQDHANASSSMLFDVTRREWSEELLEACTIDVGTLPPLRQSTEVLGGILPRRAAEIGVSSALVIVGTGDDHAAALAAGAVEPGIVADITGTAEPVGAASNQPVFDQRCLLETHAHAIPQMWFIENPGFVSGGSVMWAAQLLDTGQLAVLQLAAEADPGSGGLVFVPALSGAVAPRWNDSARGSFTGISMDHGRAEWSRAILEGCAFALRDNVDRLSELGFPTEQINVTGGGARSELWLRIKADVTHRPVKAVQGEGAALGAACLAAVAAGWFADAGEATRALVTTSDVTYEPDAAVEDMYEDAYGRYLATFDALEPTYSWPL
jgi:xylulokinase